MVVSGVYGYRGKTWSWSNFTRTVEAKQLDDGIVDTVISVGATSSDIAPNPIRQVFEHMFCRREKRALCDLAAMQLSFPAL